MAIDDNTSYELTGAQVKDLASRIKGNTKLAKDLTGGESRTSQLIYMTWIDIENAQRIADELSDTILTVQNNMVYRFFYAATGNEIKSPDDLGTLIDAGYVIEYLNQPGLSSSDNAQDMMVVTAAKCIVDDEDEEIYHAELQLKSISQATGNVISKNIVVNHAPSGASYWYKTTTTEGPAGRVACLVQDMFGSGEANGITAEINASLPEGVDPLSPNQVWSIMDLVFRDPKTGEYCKTISQIRALLRSGNSYKGQVVYIPHDDNNSAGMVITRYGWTGNASTGHGFVDILDLNTGELRTYNVANISQAGFTDNRQYCWYYVYVDSAKMNYSCGFFEDNATVYDVTTDAPSLKFEVAYDANDNLYMASDNTAASDWKQINNDAIVPFTGTDGTAAGVAGLVPAPAAGDTNKYLKSDGTWAAVSGGSSHVVRIELDDYLPNNTGPGTVEVVKNSLSQAEYDSLLGTIASGDSIMLYHTDSNDDHAEWYYIDDIVDNTTYLTLHISSTYSKTGGTALCGYDNIYVYPPSNDYPNGQISAACFPLRSSWFAGTDVYYGTSSTTSTASTKVVTTTSNFKLEEGVVLFVYFTYQHSQTTLKLNVNSLGAKTVYANGGSTSNNDGMWKANDVVCFVYDGSKWRMLDADRATTAYYGKVKLASSYTSSSSDTVPTSSHLYSVYTIANGKQDQLIAGQGISISGNTISATSAGSTYTYSGAVDTTNNSFTTTITDQNSNAQNVTLNAGSNITFSSSTALGKVGPTIVPNTTAAHYADITSLTFTPTNANLGYFFVLRVYKEYQMASGTNMYQATLYLSNTTYSYSSAAEVSAAINNEQIIVNPDFMAFSNYFTQINQSSFQSDAATAISQISGVPANFGGTIDSFGQAAYVDVYVYVLNESAFTISATGGSGGGAVTYYMTSGTTQGIPSYQTYIYSDAARTTVVDPDTILAAYESGNTILLKYESTQTGSSAYDMTLQVNSMSLDGEYGYKMLVSELNADNGTYNAVNTVIQTTWNGTGTFSGRWVLVRNVYNKSALIIREWS